MAKINEGDIIEGIFTIAVALYIAEGKVNKNKLNRIRTQIDPAFFATGRVTHTVAKNIKKQLPNKRADFFNVGFEMRLKPKSVTGAFGKGYQVFYESARDVGNINKKVDQLIRSIEATQAGRQIAGAVNDFLKNNKPEIVDFIVIADGIEGESSGGEIKGDVTLSTYVRSKSGSKKIHKGTIPFSIKSGSATVANLSPYKGMLDIAAAMKIKWDAKKTYSRLSGSFSGSKEQKQKFKLIKSMYSDLKKEIGKISKQPNFTETAFAFLRKSIFGRDLANVVDVREGQIKEITVEYFDKLSKTTKLDIQEKGNNLVFIDKQTKNPIFQLRTKLREEANEAKFYLEVATGIYSR